MLNIYSTSEPLLNVHHPLSILNLRSLLNLLVDGVIIPYDDEKSEIWRD